MEKLTPGTNKDDKYNPITGKIDVLEGDYSFKNFLKKYWDWSLVWLLFLIVTILELVYIVSVLGWVIEAYQDSFVGGVFASIFVPIFPGVLIGLTIFLRKWWKKLGGWI